MNIEKLVKELDRKKLSASIEISLLRLGDQAFDYLYDAVENDKFTIRQTVNALHVLFVLTREHCYGRQNQLFRLVEKKIMDDRKEIRAEASVVAIYLARVGEGFPKLGILYNKTDLIIAMKTVLHQGIPEPARSFVENYVSEYNSRYTLLLKTESSAVDLNAAKDKINSVKDKILSGGKSKKAFGDVGEIVI